MNVLNDIELDYLQKMIDIQFDFDSWGYGQYGAGCSFTKTIDDLTYNVWYSGSIVQLDVYKIVSEGKYSSRLGIRLHDVAGWDVENKKILYRNKVYPTSGGCTIVGRDEIPLEIYNSVLIVLDKLEENKDKWRQYYKADQNDT